MRRALLNQLRYLFLLALKALARTFYRFDIRIVGDDPEPFTKVRFGILLNHTSLMEPVYIGAFPNAFVKRLAYRAIYPGAKETLDRPIVGRLFKILAPKVVSLTRKRDSSWDEFLDYIVDDSLILFIPEGRMKRRTGLDKNNNPMTLRGGIVDLLTMIETGKLLICYSGGLHHIQAPGEGFPKLSGTIRCAFEAMDIGEYLRGFNQAYSDEKAFRSAILRDLEERRDRICASLEP